MLGLGRRKSELREWWWWVEKRGEGRGGFIYGRVVGTGVNALSGRA